ncbi:PLxRFG domain-containing protein [Moraxella atlantae]|uniref:PLxRFG domain-containing protein n=1 Tax=Faucicola atlantae TaxID=34059 RepID=UPI00375087BD
MSDKKPWEDFAQNTNTDSKPWQDFGGKNKADDGNAVTDIGKSLAKGTHTAFRGIVGLADFVAGTNIGRNVKNAGYDAKAQEDLWQESKSAALKQKEQELQNKQGFIDTAKYAITNPTLIANQVAESLPATIAGGGIGGGIGQMAGLSAAARGALAEGLQQTGTAYSDAQIKNNYGEVSDREKIAALGSGATTGAFGFVGGKLASKLGIGDVDAAIASRIAGEVDNVGRPLGIGGYAKAIGKSALSEGVFEEMPQSATEQMWQNYADGKPIMEGAANAAAMGALTGAAMGGGFAAARGFSNQRPNENQDPAADNALTGDVLPPDGRNGLPYDAPQPNTLDGTYRDVTPSNAPRLPYENNNQSTTGAPTTPPVLPPPTGAVDNTSATPNTEPNNPNIPSAYPFGINNQSQFEPPQQNMPAALPYLPEPIPTPAKRLGLDPNHGTLSSAATIAVDSGASPSIPTTFMDMQSQSPLTAVAQNNNLLPQLDYNPQTQSETQNSVVTDTPQQAAAPNEQKPITRQQIAAMWDNQTIEQRMAILDGINVGADRAMQQLGSTFDRLPLPISKKIGQAVSEQLTQPQAEQQTNVPDSQSPQQNAAPAIEPILGKDGKNKWFATQKKADEFIQKKNLGDNYTIEQTGKMRYEIVPKVQPQTEQTAQPNTGSSSKADDQWLSNFTNQMLQDKQLSSQLSNPSNSDELTFSEFSRKFDENLAKNFANNTDNANEQILLQNKNDNEVAKRQAYQLAKAQINQNQQIGDAGTLANNTETPQPKLYGKESYIQTGSERQPTRVAIVEADELVPDDKNTDNQFRDRTRVASQVQIDSIANNLDPRQLMDSSTMATGAPTLANDGKTIIAGNGRTKAIKQAYAQGRGEEYRQSLIQQANDLGIDPQKVAGMKNPVLIKEFINPVDTKKMAIESNATGGLAMSAKEQARADSALLPDISTIKSDDKGNINLSANASIFRQFIGAMPVEARASMLSADGMLSQEGVKRLQNAVLYKAYGDTKAFDDMVENTDVDVKNAINGLTQAAPKIARTKEGIKQGVNYDADISDDIASALAMLQQLRKNGMSVSDYLAQIGLFEDNLSPIAKDFVQYLDENIRSAKAITDLITTYYENLDRLGSPKQENLFGGKPNTDRQSLFNQALEQVKNAKQPKQTTNDLFAEPTANTEGQSTNQADHAAKQRPTKSQGDGAGVVTGESEVDTNAVQYLRKERAAQKPTNVKEGIAKNDDSQIHRPTITTSKGEQLTLIGENRSGDKIYEDSRGVRVLDEGGFLNYEAVSIDDFNKDGKITFTTEERQARYLTKDELANNQVPQKDTKPTNVKEGIAKIQAEKKAAKNLIAEKSPQVDNKDKDIASRQEQDNATDTRSANEPLSGVLAGTKTDPMGSNEPNAADKLPSTNSSRGRANDDSLYSAELDNADDGTIASDGRYQDELSSGVAPKTADEAITSSIEQANEPVTNFTLTNDMGIGKGSMRDKLAINLDIMDLLRLLEKENRKPTVEEKTLMAQYTGFGGLSDAFPNSNGEFKKGWEELGNRLKNTLTPEQYKTARASTTSAFFTPPSVIQAMWDIAERLGYNGGMVLEPSIGIGSFIGFAPKKPQGFIGSEIDGTTFAIAKHLYPQANLFNKGYETLPVADNSVDLAIGNPPYGSVKLNFVNKPHLNGKTIANQFMLSTLEQVKPNGLSIMVVSSNFMDSINTANREEMAKLGNLEHAIRLPNSTFNDAGTAVVADILVFRKHDQDTLDTIAQDGLNTMPPWVRSSKISLDGVNEVNFNPFFNDKLAGELQAASGEGGRAIYTIKAKGSIDKALKDFVKSIEKVKPTRTAKQIEKEINTTNQSMIDSLVLEAEGNSIGDIRRDENGRITQVIERTDGTKSQLVKRELSSDSVWSDSYTQDLDGRWYKIEDVKDKKGKSVKVLDKDGNPTKANLKQKVYFADDNIPTQSKLGARGYNILSHSIDLLGILENQLQLEQSSTSDNKDIEANRKKLAKAYNDFVKQYGYLNNPRNVKFIKNLPKANLVFALEKSYTPEKATGSGKNKNITQKESAKASDILIKRMIVPKSRTNHAETAKEALTLSLAYRGKVDIDLMAELTGKPPQAIIAELNEIESPVIFNNPATNAWETVDEYLSGNVREKIKEAEQRGLAKNVQALEAVLPSEVPVENIAMRLGMNWIPTEIYTDFAKHLLGTNAAKVSYEPLSNTYSVTGHSTQARHNEFMGGGKSPEWLLERILNNRKIEVKETDHITKKSVLKVAETEEANEKAQAIKGEFESWLYANSDTVTKLAELFNKVHNAIVERKFDGSHLELSGKVPNDIIKLRTHQNNAVWRGVTTNAVLYDHAVGSGKTFTGIARAMERKHLGLSKKPVLVVPNHMVNQFAQDIYKLYPAANILTAGKRDFEKKNRKKLFGKIATNDYDIIVLPHSSFEFIKLSKETQRRYLEEEKARIEQAIIVAKAESGSRDMTTKQLETLRANLETKIKRLTETKRNDDEISFEQMGIDDITVDEAHEFKNLFFTTKMQGVKGLGTPTGSNKAMDLWLKTKYIHETGGALAFMTGTPISNSAAEMHAMMRYLIPKTLEDSNVINFDAWANTYAENKAKFEATESGRLKLTTRFAREWQNMGSLMAMWRIATDSVTNNDIKATYRAENNGAEFPLPRVANGNRQPVNIKPTASQDHMLELILAGFKMVEHGNLSKEEKAVLRLKLMDLATKNALDPRIIDPKQEAGGKLQAVADNTFEIYQKWNKDKGTQIIFLDRSMPKSKSDTKVIAEYDAVIAERDKAIASNDDDALLKANDKLEKFDENEIAELKSAQNGGFNAYDEIKRLLIRKGVPADEIVFIQEANTDEEKKAIFDKVNSGEVRIILGSTPRMGAGTNIQQRLVALHHVDAPWKPSDIEQREGRIIRQGNELYAKYGHNNFEVDIKAYITEKTADAKRWDTMSAKLGTINAIRNYKGEHTLDFEEDDGDASFQEIAALATGNPSMLERMELIEVRNKLNRALTTFRKREAGDLGRLNSAKQAVEHLPKRIEAAKSITTDYEATAAIAKAEYDKQSITIDGKVFNTRKSANAYAKEKAELAKQADKKATYVINGENIGSYTAADTKIKELIGNKPDIPMLLEVGSKQYSNPSDMMTDNLMNKVNSHPVQPVFKLMGFDVTSYDDGGMTLMVVEHGDQVLAQRSLDKQATGIKIINAISDLAKQLDSKVPFLESDLQRSLEIHKQTIETLQDKVGKPFPEQEQLDSASERLTQLQAILGEEDKPEITDIDQLYFNELNNLLDGMADRRNNAKSKPEAANTDSQQYSQTGNRTDTTKQKVLNTLYQRFGKATIDKLIADGNLEIIDYAEAKRRNPNTPSNADGYYTDGKAVLIADNLSPDMIIPTFLHELGGHGGLQTLMSDKAYQSLMREFDAMVKRGDKIAVDAKNLADAHSPNAKVAQDEYLPYLISLASRNQGNGKIKSLLNRIVLAVKSFIRDKFGVNLKVTPADIAALAEKMVDDRANLATNKDILSAIPTFSQSALKSVTANIKRGKDAMNKALTEKTSIHRAMYRNDIGWVDFVWGDVGVIKANGNTKGGKGLSHIIEARMRKNDMSYNEVTKLFTKDIVETIAKGETVDVKSTNDEIKIKVDLNGNRVVLLKEKGSNSWMVTAFELSKDDSGKVHGKTTSTEHQSYSARTDAGALDNNSINPTNQDDKQNDIRYSQLGGYSPQVSKLSQMLSDFLKNPLSFVKTVTDNKITDHLGKGLALLGRRQLVDIYKNALPDIKLYSDTVEQMDADSNEKAFDADKLVKEWAKLKDERPLAELMHDATLKGIDPAEAYQPGDDRAIYQQLKRRYDNLSPEAQRIYKQARDDYKAHQRSVFNAIKGRIQRSTMSAPKQAELIKKMEQGFFFGQKVYFPLARFGKYVIVVKDAAGNVVNASRAETKAQAEEIRKALIKDYPNDKVGRVMLDKEFVGSRDGVSRGFMSDLFDAVDNLNLGAQERAEFEDTLGQLYLNSLPDMHFAKSGIHRKGTAGFSQNARRAYAQHMSRGSHYVAKMRHADVLSALLDDMQDYVKQQGEADPNYDQPKMQRVVDEMEKRHDLLMNPKSHPASSLATSIGFVWYMGLSPASAIVNLTQTVLVAYPVMGARWGFAKAGKALADVSALTATHNNDLSNVLTGDEKKAFEEAVRRGAIDLTQAHDLAGIANGEDEGIMWKLHPVMKAASFMFHHAEKFNRQVTFVAAYRLARQAGTAHKSAIEQAIDATYEGHFSYASSNRPRIMQGNWQRVLFLFKQYGQNMVYALARNAYLSLKGDTQAMKALGGMLALHGTFAGVLGLPMVSTLLAMASALGGDDDEPWDAEIALRNLLADMFGDDMSEVISKGLPRAAGIDLSSRVGLDSLILPRVQEGLEGQRAGENILTGFAGPVAGIGVNAMAGMNDIKNGNTLIGVEKMLPKVLKDTVKTYRYATEGIVDKTGIEIMPQESVSLSDIGQQALGFRSAKIAQSQEGKSAIFQMDKKIGKRRQQLMDEYARAKMAGRDERAEEIWRDIKRFNDSIGDKYPKLRITKVKLMQSIKQRKRRIAEAENGIYLPSSREASREYGAFATE